LTRQKLRHDISALTSHSTNNQRTRIQEHKNALQRKIDSWCAIQELYIPALGRLRRSFDLSHGDQPQDIELWLPSAISGKITCEYRLYEFEWDLRVAQANDSLSELRQSLQLRSHLYKYKDRFTAGQRANTRANTCISRVQRQIKASVTRYRISHKALLSLSALLNKDDSWKIHLPKLYDGDVRAMTVGEEGETEGRRTLSWIWRRGGDLTSNDDNGNLHECTCLSIVLWKFELMMSKHSE
jgi:hypothetical protein